MGVLPARQFWGRIGIVAVSLGLAAAVVVGAFALAFAITDNPRKLDDDGVITLVREECTLLHSTVDQIAEAADEDNAAERLLALEDQNVAIEKMVSRLAAIPADVRADDQPLDGWLADWEALVLARRAYIARASVGALATFRMPTTDDGDPIAQRMDKAVPEDCRVPADLLEPDNVGGQAT